MVATSWKALATSMLASSAIAAPTLERRDPTCTEFVIPVEASAPTQVFSDVPANITDPQVLAFFITSQASGGLGALLGAAGTVITGGNYNISMRYCEPENKVESRADTVQLLVHGLTYTKSYWSGLGYETYDYSWVDYASQQGYPTLAIDQLGNGGSSHPDALLSTQQTLQVEIIHEIITMLRAGTIPNDALSGKAFSKVLYVGHSVGSICGNAIATHYPTDIDTFILTGYSPYFLGGAFPLVSGVPAPAILENPARFGSLIDPLYLAQTVAAGRQNTFYTNTFGYDLDLVQYDFDNEGTVSLGEIATILFGLDTAPDYKGNVLVVTGDQDAVVCNALTGPDCGSGSTSNPQQASKFWPGAKNYTVSIPANTGHSTTLHLSARRTFALAHSYLAAHGF